MTSIAQASGKIILTGEYAVVFGFPGIAIPSPLKMEVEFEALRARREDRDLSGINVEWIGIEGDENWNAYLKDILNYIERFKGKILQGRLTINNELPLGKGMGSSTSLVIAVSKCLLGDNCRNEALAIEDKVNPGHSGIDFNVIWENTSLLFSKEDGFKPIELPDDLLKDAVLIDTGKPNETTSELVEFVSRSRGSVTPDAALEEIGECTNELLNFDAAEIHESPLRDVFKKHHRAQVALGIVPEEAQNLISEIEGSGGAAKVLGAGGRTGGGGMVLAIHKKPGIFQIILDKYHLKCTHLNEK